MAWPREERGAMGMERHEPRAGRLKGRGPGRSGPAAALHSAEGPWFRCRGRESFARRRDDQAGLRNASFTACTFGLDAAPAFLPAARAPPAGAAGPVLLAPAPSIAV